MPTAQSFSESAPDAPAVAVIVVHYNCLRDTLRCLASLEKLTYRNFFVILIDSSSPDGSGEVLRDRLAATGVRVILSPDNAGFAAANNIGIRYGSVLDAEYFWLLNPDTTVAPDALERLVDRASAALLAGAWGSKILYGARTDGEEARSNEAKIWSAGGSIDIHARSLRMEGAGELDRGQFEQERECDYVPGCSMLVRREVVEKAGYMPEEYFMYFEETDWCMRIRRAGFTLEYVPQSVVWHHFDDEKMQKPFGIYYYNRNQRLFWFRHSPWRGRMIVVIKTLFQELPRALHALAHAPDPGFRSLFQAHSLSCIDFLTGRFGPRWMVPRAFGPRKLPSAGEA